MSAQTNRQDGQTDRHIPYSRWTINGCLTSTRISRSILVRTRSRTVKVIKSSQWGMWWWVSLEPGGLTTAKTAVTNLSGRPSSIPSWHRVYQHLSRPPCELETPTVRHDAKEKESIMTRTNSDCFICPIQFIGVVPCLLFQMIPAQGPWEARNEKDPPWERP